MDFGVPYFQTNQLKNSRHVWHVVIACRSARSDARIFDTLRRVTTVGCEAQKPSDTGSHLVTSCNIQITWKEYVLLQSSTHVQMVRTFFLGRFQWSSPCPWLTSCDECVQNISHLSKI